MVMETSPNFEKEPNFDESIKELSSLASITVYERLNATNDKLAKEEFLEDSSLVHPRNVYGNLSEEEVRNGADRIDDIMEHLVTDNPRQRLLAQSIADDGIKKYNFLAANIGYNAASTPEEKEFAANYHHKTNEALYGKADEDVFYQILNYEISKIDTTSLSPEDTAKYDKMLAAIGPIKDAKKPLYRPSQENFARFSEMAKEFFAPFLQHIPEDKENFTPEELAGIFNDIFRDEFGGMEIPYHAEVTDSVSNVDANHELHTIRIPQNVKKPYSAKRCKELVVHELGTHIYRAIPYLDQNIGIFSLGLPNNEVFDEGIAECVSQAITGNYDEVGHEHYINIGLATFKNKNFREVYEIQSALKSLTGKKNTVTLNKVQRCFRGTGELPNNKDLAYYNGTSKVWQYIEKHIDDPMLFDDLFLSGKANIEIADQSRLVYEMKTRGTL